MNKILLTLASAALAVAGISCSGGNSAQALQEAAHVADSLVNTRWNANVEVNGAQTGLDATFRVSDSLINVDAIGNELFDLFAAYEIKQIPADDINLISKAVLAAKGEINVQLIAPGDKSKTFVLSPKRFVELQKAMLTQLNPSVAKTQLLKVAENFCPNPKAHEGAKSVDVSVVKSFLEYNVIWPSEKAFAGKDQSVLTVNYFNALKQEYQQLGALAHPAIQIMESLGIDGVRMVYSAEGSEREIKQAFPWREIQKPIEETKK